MRIVSGAGSLKSPGKFEEPGQEGWVKFSPKPRQRACQDPLTRQGGDALTKDFWVPDSWIYLIMSKIQLHDN